MSVPTSALANETQQALFCVCADEGVAALAGEAAVLVKGCVFFGVFRDYISAEKRPQFSSALKNADACVALINFDQDSELALETAERLRYMFATRISIVGLGRCLDAVTLIRAMRIGCSDFLTTPLDVETIRVLLVRLQDAANAGAQLQRKAGQLLALFGSKGGVGTTTLAVHLATFLVRKHKKKTLLIDHKHQLGHVALYLGLKNTDYHFTELLRSADRLDADLLEGFILHHESGLDVIASPEKALAEDETKRDELYQVMEFLRREYDYILVDSTVGYRESKSSLIDQTDELYLVSTPDVAALRDLARLVEDMSLSKAGMGKLRLIINRAMADDPISADLIQKAVRFPVSFSITNSYFEVMRAINAGEPIAPEAKSVFCQQIAAWADNIVAERSTETIPAPANRLRSLWKKRNGERRRA